MKLKLNRRGMAHQVVWAIVSPDNAIEATDYKTRKRARDALRHGTWPWGSRVARMLVIYTVKGKPT